MKAFGRFLASAVFLLSSDLATARPTETMAPLMFDAATAESLSLQQAVQRMADSSIIVFGEHHDSVADHRAQLQLIQALFEHGVRLSVGAEVLGFGSQSIIDAFVDGSANEEDLFREFSKVANPRLYPFYQRIFSYCREKEIPMVGLRADTDVLLKLFFQGRQGLTEEDRLRLPGYDPTCVASPKYEELMRAFADRTMPFATVGAEQGHLCDFFMGLDSVMGYAAAEYVNRHPGRTLIVLAGIAHSWKSGIPHHVARHHKGKVTVVLPSSERDPLLGFNVFPSEADYVWWHD